MEDQLYTPPQGPPQVSAPQLFDRIGLERLYEMAWRQYQQFPASPLAEMFPHEEAELKAASRKQAEFMCGLLGGPKLYHEKYGPPRMRARHFPFAIDEQARREWLRCFDEAFQACGGLGLPEGDQQKLCEWIEAFSGWMVNRKSGRSADDGSGF